MGVHDGSVGIVIKKTHCYMGHEFTEQNTRLEKYIRNGKTFIGRRCRKCASGAVMRSKKRKANERSKAIEVAETNTV